MANIVSGPFDIKGKDKFSPASKFIESVEYDSKEMTMDITFHSGSKHRYLRVFPMTFLSFKQSPTHDAFYSRAIRGQLMSVKLINTNIGRKVSTPLNQVKKEHHLDAGIRTQLARKDRIAGTVSRAINAAGVA